MKIDTLSVDFTDEQKRYLEGFTTGLQISRVGVAWAAPEQPKAVLSRVDRMRRTSRPRTRSLRLARSLPIRKNSSATSIRFMPIRG